MRIRMEKSDNYASTKSFKENKNMKSAPTVYAVVLSAILCFIFINGCEMDVAGPIWDKPYTVPPTPTITSVVPAQAAAGVLTITINGEDFASAPGFNSVYFDNISSEVISSTSSSIVVRRPNLVTDSAVIKVVSSQANSAVKYFPYKVEQVMERYGNFDENITLSVIAVDNQENVYVIEGNNVHKVSLDGTKSVFATANRSSYDAILGLDGNLYLLGNNRAVDKVNLSTGQVTRWTQMPSGKNVRYGDFDDHGNFYAGGNKTDLVVVGTNLSAKPASGYYAGFDILAVRAYTNYVYVVAKNTAYVDTAKIFRHQIDTSGSLGAQELVLDMRTSGDLSLRTIKGISFSTAGIMHLATDAVNPIVTYNPANGNIDYLYKEILRPYCKSFYWGTGNFIYMINGDATAGEAWTVYRVNAGINGIH
jgi:hypothetical protein